MSLAPSSLAPRFPRALVVMAKEPRPGRCKTRLCPPLEPEEACRLYGAFLRDIERELRGWDGGCDLWLAWADDAWPSDAPGLPPTLSALFGRAEWRALRQRGDDLASRMDFVFDTLFGAGYRSVVMRNSDSPHLPPSHLLRAFDELERLPGGVVLGPDLDGGYYLVGLDRPPGELFPRVMSHGTVLEQTLEAAARLGRPSATLAEFLDVDTPDDLVAFRLEFEDRADYAGWATTSVLAGLDLDERLSEPLPEAP